MARLQSLCPAQLSNGEQCARPIEIVKNYDFLNYCDIYSETWSKLNQYKCGHIFHNDHIANLHNQSTELLTNEYFSLDQKKKTRHYQVEGLRFIEETNFNCLVADQQGLGKTIEALLALRENKEKLLPALVIVKSATIWQWQKEIKEWCDSNISGVWMIRDGKQWIPPGFSIYLISMDTLRSFVHVQGEANGNGRSKNKSKTKASSIKPVISYETTSKIKYTIDSRITALGIKTVVADEVHSFKNDDSKRSQALVELVSQLNIKHKIFLSGTPIKNRASEYFIPLNLLDPVTFPSKQHFARHYLTDDWKRIHPYMMDKFKSVTDSYIIRRERNQVLTDLPPFQRVFEDVFIESESLKRLYNLELEKMEAKSLDKNSGKLSYNDIKDNLMAMRRIIGMAKAETIIETVNEFLESTEDEKIVIGIHHHAVRDYLLAKFSEHRPLSLSGDDSSDRKNDLVEAFKKPDRRLMIVNIIAGGTGLNLQFCNNCIVLERQWNSADEEQFEDRFNRIGQTLPVTAAYPVAKKTIDEWFSDMVEEKRAIFGETVAVDFSTWMEQGTVQDMVDWATSNRL